MPRGVLGELQARAELLLAEAFLASRSDVSRVPLLLAEVEPLLEQDMPAEDKACLRLRWIDQLAYELNKARPGKTPDHAAAEALYRGFPTEGTPAFARCRHANGLAYARWKQGDPEHGAALARQAAEHAGDGGHLRLRAMSLTMLSRIATGPEAESAHRRALAIATMLEDEGLRMRFERGHARDLERAASR